MKYYLDTEFNGDRGELISLALVEHNTGEGIYLRNHAAMDYRSVPDKAGLVIQRPWGEVAVLDPIPWVRLNVIPVLSTGGMEYQIDTHLIRFGHHIERYLHLDPEPVIIADWPVDIEYFCNCLHDGAGRMVDLQGPLRLELHRVDAYPTDLEGAVQHNAWWDAMALRHYFLKQENEVP
jgi:hypothetical protein